MFRNLNQYALLTLTYDLKKQFLKTSHLEGKNKESNNKDQIDMIHHSEIKPPVAFC